MLEVESNSVLIATLVLIGFIGALHPDFLSWGQLKEVVQNSVYVGIIAAGMAFLISMREIDLSRGLDVRPRLIVSALLIKHGMNPWLAGLLGVLLGCAMGLFNAGPRPVHRDPGDRRHARHAVASTAASARRSPRASRSPACPPRTASSPSSAATSSGSRSASGS